MSLQINTNVAALNAQRNLSSTNRTLGGLFGKLSSGMRVPEAMPPNVMRPLPPLTIQSGLDPSSS